MYKTGSFCIFQFCRQPDNEAHLTFYRSNAWKS